MAQAAVQQSATASAPSNETVTVASKMPNGLVLREFVERQERELVMGGGTRDVTVYRETGNRVTIAGTTVRMGAVPPLLFGGYRLTTGVPKSIWDQWLKANLDSEMVKNKLIFAHGDNRRAEDEARGYDKIETGLEGIDPDNPSKKTRINVTRMDVPKR